MLAGRTLCRFKFDTYLTMNALYLYPRASLYATFEYTVLASSNNNSFRNVQECPPACRMTYMTCFSCFCSIESSTLYVPSYRLARAHTQAKQLLDEVARFRAGHEQARGLPSGSIPLIVAGDFNATPRSSVGYEPLCYRQVTAHPLALRSALPTGEDFFTTWKIRPANKPPVGGSEMVVAGGTRESKHCIDYMWVTSRVRPTSGSTLPSAEELGPTRAPSFVYPSDHFAIAADLRLPPVILPPV